MLAFRGEDHVERWCRANNVGKGCIFSLSVAWGLGRAWYADKLSPTWRRATPARAEAIFAGLGLTGEFWRLS